jgi:hypothetical protein
MGLQICIEKFKRGWSRSGKISLTQNLEQVTCLEFLLFMKYAQQKL